MTDRQLPNGDEVFLDHVGYFVTDLETAAHRLTRLGFQVSAVNVQYNSSERGEWVPAGTSNRLVMLKQGFIETLAATDTTPLADQLCKALARYQGLHLIAMTHADVESQRRRLMEAGFAMQPIVHLRRRVDTAAGERQTSISVLRTVPGEMAEGRVQMLTNYTPELLWLPGSTVHANRADALTEVLICVDDPLEAALRYGRYAGRAVARAGDSHLVNLDRGRIRLVSPATAAALLPGFTYPTVPYIAAVALRTTDLATTRSVLAQRGIRSVIANDRAVCVGPSDALGAYLLFHEASGETPWDAIAS